MVLPVAMILYGTLVVGVRPPVLPLIGAVALAGLMGAEDGLPLGKIARKGCLRRSDASRSPSPSCAGRHDHRSVARLGDHSRHHLLGLKLIAPEHFLLSAMVLCSVASIAQALHSGPWGPSALALLGVGQALGYPQP